MHGCCNLQSVNTIGSTTMYADARLFVNWGIGTNPRFIQTKGVLAATSETLSHRICTCCYIEVSENVTWPKNKILCLGIQINKPFPDFKKFKHFWGRGTTLPKWGGAHSFPKLLGHLVPCSVGTAAHW